VEEAAAGHRKGINARHAQSTHRGYIGRNRLGRVSPILARLACQTARCRRLHEDARLQPGFRVNTERYEQRPADS
jgi:hypothetical protein